VPGLAVLRVYLRITIDAHIQRLQTMGGMCRKLAHDYALLVSLLKELLTNVGLVSIDDKHDGKVWVQVLVDL
jgi:hypothetical protein